MDISIIFPAYHEAENLKNILPRLHALLENAPFQYRVIVMDTMTPTDDTEEICQQHGAEYLRRQGGNFYGDAIRTGIKAATGTYTVIMDADGSHDPKDIISFYQAMQSGRYDLVIGSRYCKGGYTDNNFILRFMSWGLNVTYRLLFHLKVKDVSDSFRMYKTEQLQALEFECNDFDIVEEIIIKLNLLVKDFSVLEIPIAFSKRAAGESKRQLVKFIISYVKTIVRLKKIQHSAKARMNAKETVKHGEH